MANGQRGFTLIELITVIIILGILSAIALPKFIDLTNCSAANAAGTTVSCVVNATKGTTTRSATATIVCTG